MTACHDFKLSRWLLLGALLLALTPWSTLHQLRYGQSFYHEAINNHDDLLGSRHPMLPPTQGNLAADDIWRLLYDPRRTEMVMPRVIPTMLAFLLGLLIPLLAIVQSCRRQFRNYQHARRQRTYWVEKLGACRNTTATLQAKDRVLRNDRFVWWLASTSQELDQCAICLEHYQSRDVVVWSSNKYCVHNFHQDCVLTWFSRNHRRNNCPCCRQPFFREQ